MIMIIGLVFVLGLGESCELSQKYWCDSFNGQNSCFYSQNCATYNTIPIKVPEVLVSKYQESLGSLLKSSECVIEKFYQCEGESDLEDYLECVDKSNCEQLIDPEFLSTLPEETWIAVRPRYLQKHSVPEEEMEEYSEFQECIISCREVCEASNDNDRECIENCVLTFCAL